MGVIEDVRKVFQDLVAPELKSLAVEAQLRDQMTQLKVDALSAKMDAKIDALSAKVDALSGKVDARIDSLGAKMEGQHIFVMNALDLNRRVETLERVKATASA